MVCNKSTTVEAFQTSRWHISVQAVVIGKECSECPIGPRYQSVAAPAKKVNEKAGRNTIVLETI